MAEEMTEYEQMRENSHPVLKTVLKALLIALIVFVFGAVFIRSCARRPEKHILYSDRLAAEMEKGNVTVLYQSPYDSINRNEYGTFQFSISDFYYIPATKQLQVTLRYNVKTLQDAQKKYGLDKTPEDDCFAYSLLTEDGERIDSYGYSSYKSGRYRFIYLLFDNVDLDEYTLVNYAPADAAVTDSSGNIIAHETDAAGRNILYETDDSGAAKVYVRSYVSLETYYIDDVNYRKSPLSSLMVFNRTQNFQTVRDYEKYVDTGREFPITYVNAAN